MAALRWLHVHLLPLVERSAGGDPSDEETGQTALAELLLLAWMIDSRQDALAPAVRREAQGLVREVKRITRSPSQEAFFLGADGPRCVVLASCLAWQAQARRRPIDPAARALLVGFAASYASTLAARRLAGRFRALELRYLLDASSRSARAREGVRRDLVRYLDACLAHDDDARAHAYVVTHLVFYATDFLCAPLDLPGRVRRSLRRFLSDRLARLVGERDDDLAMELLICGHAVAPMADGLRRRERRQVARWRSRSSSAAAPASPLDPVAVDDAVAGRYHPILVAAMHDLVRRGGCRSASAPPARALPRGRCRSMPS